jgi:hypothetical protein
MEAGPKVGLGEAYVVDRRKCSDLPEARFWITSGLPTIRELMAISALHRTEPQLS